MEQIMIKIKVNSSTLTYC